MKDFMLTVWSASNGARDIQVNNAPDMQTAIALAEKETGCRVDHGRSGIGSDFDPGTIIDARTGIASFVHDRPAPQSMEIVNVFKEKFSTPKGEGKK